MMALPDPKPSPLADVACVIIHHRNYPGVLDTLRSLRLAGVDERLSVIVDNSEDEDVAKSLARYAVSPTCVVPNRGYGSAVNNGVRFLNASGRARRYTLVATHEVLVTPATIRHLVSALARDGEAAVAGPTLLTAGVEGDVCWSRGGYESPWLNIPGHVGWGRRAGRVAYSEAPVDRAWLDGALALYKTELIENRPVPEFYFLYFEDADYHRQLRGAGYKVLWVPTAEAWQRSEGTPAYFKGRNLQIYQEQHGNAVQKAFAVPYALAKSCAKVVCGRDRPADVLDMIRGWTDGLAWARHRTGSGRLTPIDNRSERGTRLAQH